MSTKDIPLRFDVLVTLGHFALFWIPESAAAFCAGARLNGPLSIVFANASTAF